MPLKGLRPNRTEREQLHRRSTLDPANLFKRGKSSNDLASSHYLSPDHAVSSEDGKHDPPEPVARASWSPDNPPSPPIQEHTPNTRRFSMLRFRHASDSQLSAKAREQAAGSAPPVPAMPAAPAIITTAPTMETTAQPTNKKNRFQQFAKRRLSFDPDSAQRPSSNRKSIDKSRNPEKRSVFGSMRGSSSLDINEPGRLSTSTAHNPPSESGADGTSSLALPVPRLSDSSRSDGSSGDHVTFATPHKHHQASKTGTLFNFSRRNKPRAPLFPLPVKIPPPPEFPNTAPATPRASTSAVSTGSATHSPAEYSPPQTAIHRSHGSHLADSAENGSTPSALSPSHAGPASSVAFGGPNSLFRQGSVHSTRSSRSSPTAKPPMRLGLRGRSSTMGSLSGRSDTVPPPTPPYGTSGRNSTSTAGRSSFSNLFGLSHRLRHGSEPHSPRHGSPGQGVPGTPGLNSHTNSFNMSREALPIPKREEGEPPGKYLERLEAVMDKGVIASVVSKSADPFSLAVLRSYMRKFSFFGDPIDMAIRKLLMEVELPKETQQIDRVLQGFADRYHECNPGIFISPDQAYFISFSIVILHTDFFNKNNKRKMQKQDYVKNAASEGVSEDVLSCLYDNIVYTPFIHFEDDIDLKGSLSRKTKKAILKAPMHAMNDPARKVTKEPIDPYTLIFENRLDILRPNVKEVMNVEDPYNYRGTFQTLDIRMLHASFSKYGVIQIVSARSRPEAFMTAATIDNPNDTQAGVVEMPVTKVGILWRKDSKKKAARSPWQEWGAILTRSGISFFRNSGWAKNLMHQWEQHLKQGHDGIVVFKPAITDFKPDHAIPMDGTVALMDMSYKKHKNAFMIFSKGGIEETFLADNEAELNDWLGKLNYTAAFETQGVRPRGLIGGLYEGQRHRGIRRLESAHSTKSVQTATGDVTIQSGKIDTQLAQQIATARRELVERRIKEAEDKLAAALKQLESQERDARHLQILAPVHPKTREQVVHAAGRMAAKLKWLRIEFWRMKCHRDILISDLEEEKRTVGESAARILQIQGGTSSTLATAPNAKASKVSGLARLNSKASNIMGSKGSPHSPSFSLRPATKSSKDTDFGDDVFRTPPEQSRQSSPGPPPGNWELPPLSFNTPSPKLLPADHRGSVSTLRTTDASSISDVESRYTTPTNEDEGVKETIEPVHSASVDGRPRTPSEKSEADPSPGVMSSPESRSKVRRSLHRTLRDNSTPGHRRGGKGKDSTSTIMSDDLGAPESEGLSRAKGSFTLHGKKASVITFGAEWQNMPAEERLKVRKQAHEEDGRLAVPSAIEDEPEPLTPGLGADRASIAGASMSTRESETEHTPRARHRPSDISIGRSLRQHASSDRFGSPGPTINGYSEEKSEADSAAERSGSKSEDSDEKPDEDPASGQARLQSPQPQAVEA